MVRMARFWFFFGIVFLMMASVSCMGLDMPIRVFFHRITFQEQDMGDVRFSPKEGTSFLEDLDMEKNGSLGTLGDLWEYQIEGNQWRFLSGYEKVGARNNFGMSPYFCRSFAVLGSLQDAACWVENDKLVVHGGYRIYLDGLYFESYKERYTYDPFYDDNGNCITGSAPCGCWKVDYSSKYGDFSNYLTDFHPNQITPPLFGHTATVMNTSNLTNRVLIFGGAANQVGFATNLLFEWSIDLQQFRFIKGGFQFTSDFASHTANSIINWQFFSSGVGYSQRGVYDPTFYPRARYHHSSWSFLDKLYVFGGMITLTGINDLYYNDLWAYNHTIECWSYLIGEVDSDSSWNYRNAKIVNSTDFALMNVPTIAAKHNVWFGPRGDIVVIHGGKLWYWYYIDMWLFSPIREEFKPVDSDLLLQKSISTSEEVLGSRYGSFVMTKNPSDLKNDGNSLDNNHVFLFGGMGVDGKKFERAYQDLWKFNQEIAVECSGHGVFTFPNKVPSCACDSDLYTGLLCEWWNCGGISNNDTKNVCGGIGTCKSHDVCSCIGGYYGLNCSEFNCFGETNDCGGNITCNGTINGTCGGHGECMSPDNCTCDDPYIGERCDIFNGTCNGTMCFGNGECLEGSGTPICDCYYSYLPPYCEERIPCSDFCGGHGFCVDYGICRCNLGYFGDVSLSEDPKDRFFDDCDLWTCHSILRTNETVCDGHGSCISTDECECNDGYFPEDDTSISNCRMWTCNSILKNETQIVCNFRGNCSSYDNCNCTVDGYFGANCDEIIDRSAVFEYSRSRISVNYEVPMSHFGTESSIVDEDMFCRELILNVDKSFGNNSKCQWIFSFSETKKLLIYPEDGSKGEDVDSFVIIPPTRKDQSEHVLVNVFGNKVVEDGGGTFTSSALIAVGVTLGVLLPLLGLGCILILFPPIIFLCICCICLLLSTSILLILLFLSLYLFIRNWRYRRLKDIDILLQEQSAQRGSGTVLLNVNKSFFKINYEDLKVVKSIGSGGSNSMIFLCLWKENIQVAFKCFQTCDLFGNDGNFAEFEREVTLMSSIRHPNCLTFYGSCLYQPRIGIVMEFCKNGDLKAFLSNNEDFPLAERFRILKEGCCGMEYLHDRNVIHRDLKCENVLLAEELVAKIIDFGLSRMVDKLNPSALTKNIGTSYYIAPEVVQGNFYSEKCDIFSYSIVMWEVINHNFEPFGNSGICQIEIKIANDSELRPDLEVLPQKVKEMNVGEVLEKCWSENPEERLSFKELKLIMESFEKMLRSNDNLQQNEKEVVNNACSGDDEGEEQEKENLENKENMNLGNVVEREGEEEREYQISENRGIGDLSSVDKEELPKKKVLFCKEVDSMKKRLEDRLKKLDEMKSQI